jgi:hypothetical protein
MRNIAFVHRAEALSTGAAAKAIFALRNRARAPLAACARPVDIM